MLKASALRLGENQGLDQSIRFQVVYRKTSPRDPKCWLPELGGNWLEKIRGCSEGVALPKGRDVAAGWKLLECRVGDVLGYGVLRPRAHLRIRMRSCFLTTPSVVALNQ